MGRNRTSNGKRGGDAGGGTNDGGGGDSDQSGVGV